MSSGLSGLNSRRGTPLPSSHAAATASHFVSSSVGVCISAVDLVSGRKNKVQSAMKVEKRLGGGYGYGGGVMQCGESLPYPCKIARYKNCDL